MSLIRKGAQLALRLVCRSRWVTYLVFGVRVPRLATSKDYYFDSTTPGQVWKARKYLTKESRVLDLGAGSSALIGLSLWKNPGCHVISSDLNPDLVRSSRAAVELNKAPIKVYESRFFDGIDEPVDVVTFNPPYVKRSVAKARKMVARSSQWDGGDSGLDVIAEFLKECAGRPTPVTVLMGINRWHLDMDDITEVVKRTEGLSLDKVDSHWLLPVDIYVMRNQAGVEGRYVESSPGPLPKS